MSFHGDTVYGGMEREMETTLPSLSVRVRASYNPPSHHSSTSNAILLCSRENIHYQGDWGACYQRGGDQGLGFGALGS